MMSEPVGPTTPAIAQSPRRFPFGVIGLASVLALLTLSWFGAWTYWPVWMFIIWLVAAWACLLGLCFRPRRAAITGTVAIGIATAITVYEVVRFRFEGRLRASEYPLLLQAKRGYLDHFPKNIPAEATGIRIRASGVFMPIPTLDDFIELRFVLPPASAAALEQELADTAMGVDSANTDCYLLRTIATGASRPPFLPGFKTYRFCPPNSVNLLMVTINATTGEVVYWRFES